MNLFEPAITGILIYTNSYCTINLTSKLCMHGFVHFEKLTFQYLKVESIDFIKKYLYNSKKLRPHLVWCIIRYLLRFARRAAYRALNGG